mmetsp:Transcript_32676/g.90121  ORF Transcript_32676/g.90121 Transcript_32676/m.90121 type:complete len:254 (-) Transcript_32676:428-1189(-)
MVANEDPLLSRAALQDALQHVVPERVPRKLKGLGDEILHQIAHLAEAAMLQQSLHDPAAVTVARNLHNSPLLRADLLDDKLARLRPLGLDALLDHVVGVWAPHCVHDMPLELRRQGSTSAIIGGEFQCALHLAAANRASRQAPNVPIQSCNRLAFHRGLPRAMGMSIGLMSSCTLSLCLIRPLHHVGAPRREVRRPCAIIAAGEGFLQRAKWEGQERICKNMFVRLLRYHVRADEGVRLESFRAGTKYLVARL